LGNCLVLVDRLCRYIAGNRRCVAVRPVVFRIGAALRGDLRSVESAVLLHIDTVLRGDLRSVESAVLLHIGAVLWGDLPDVGVKSAVLSVDLGCCLVTLSDLVQHPGTGIGDLHQHLLTAQQRQSSTWRKLRFRQRFRPPDADASDVGRVTASFSRFAQEETAAFRADGFNELIAALPR